MSHCPPQKYLCIMAENIDNPFGLSPEEQRVLHYWQRGESMTDAYKKVMLSMYDAQAISLSALKKRVFRFFNTYRMREAMAATPGELGEKAKADFEKWKTTQTEDTVKRFVGKPKGLSTEERVAIENAHYEAVTGKKATVGTDKTDRDKWLESLNVNENPSSMTIYGTGQFMIYMAVKEMMARQSEIKAKGISVLDKNGSVFTPTIISALRTAAAMVLPFAPAPSAEDRREMSKAAVLLGLMPESITESPDDYTAPIPSAIDVEGSASV